MPQPAIETLKKLIAAKTPLLFVVSEGEERVERLFERAAETAFSQTVPFYTWSATRGMITNRGKVDGAPAPLLEALQWAIDSKETALFLFKDLAEFLREDPLVLRKVRDLYQSFRPTYKMLAVPTVTLDLPAGVGDLVTVLDLELPGPDELGALFADVLAGMKGGAQLLQKLSPEQLETIGRAALGLTEAQAERAFRHALFGRTSLDESVLEAIHEEKQQFIRKTEILEFVPYTLSIDEIGGMENLKTWLRKREKLFSPQARECGLSFPKGVLMMGISGCGKSLFVKAISSFWKIPLIRLDMARVYDGVFGSPEQALRKAIKVSEALAPCVLWIDEIESGISIQGFKAEGGAASRVLGSFLTWLQEKQDFVFVAATANAINLLPPELLRKGRFDEVFFVSLPGFAERKEIFRIHLNRRKQNPEGYDLDFLSSGTRGYSGAEIEQVVSSALYEAFSQGRSLVQRDILLAIDRTVPLSITMEEDIKKIEEWAFGRAVRASTKQEEPRQ